MQDVFVSINFFSNHRAMSSDHRPYNFTDGNGEPAKELSMYTNIKMIVRGYYPYQSI